MMQPQQIEGLSPAKRLRGAGRGSRFFVLDRDLWRRLWDVPTSNRLNLVTAFLVLLAGTGADHRMTKWSAKACENHAGMGKPRAQLAIKELMASGMAVFAETSTSTFPHYRLAEPASPDEPIFLPAQLVTGFGTDTPILRRIRETGDALLLRMLIDLYGLVRPDATFGVPLANLRQGDPCEANCMKAFESPPNVLWAIYLDDTLQVSGGWCSVHAVKETTKNDGLDWSPFWRRLEILQSIGALWFEPWFFNGKDLDAEPLLPKPADGKRQAGYEQILRLDGLQIEVEHKLVRERTYVLEQSFEGKIILPSHHQRPALWGVAKLVIEADTPGRRLAYARRLELIERQEAAYRQLLGAERLCNTPIGAIRNPIAAVR